jgi:Zn-dependent protease with chaperone function
MIALLGLAGGLVATAIFSKALFILILKKKVILAVLFSIWILLRSLWIKVTPPEGYILKRNDFPELFAVLDKLSKQLKSLKIHEIILNKDLNAKVVQHPRLGLFGWHKNYLILGYQLLLILPPEEMKAVLAHELGHLSGNHHRFNAWIYRIRMTWFRALSAFEQTDSWGGRLMRKFFNWYTPQFDAYSFAFARLNEYQADAISAAMTSADTATRALVNVHASAPYLDQRYWEKFLRSADDHERPPRAPFEGLNSFIRKNPLAREEMLERIKTAMQAETHYADTHPSLKDRVDALGGAPQLPTSPKLCAAEAWLGEKNKKIMHDFDRKWWNDNGDTWKKRHQYVTHARSRLRLFTKTPPSDLNDDDLWNYAYWTNEFASSKAALPLFLAFQERHPDDPDAAYFIGMNLLNKGDAAGLDHLRLARKNASLIEHVARAGYDFLAQRDQDEQANIWWRESVEQNQVFLAARREREGITPDDELLYPEVDNGLLQQMIDNLKRQKQVRKAWLAQKSVHYYPESPVYVIAFTPKGIPLTNNTAQTQVAEDLNLPGNFLILCNAGETKTLAKKVIEAGKRIL